MTNARSTATDGRAPRPNQANATEAGAPRGLGSKTPKQGKTMKGAEAVVASLEAEGVDLVFGYPGGQAIKIYDALYDSDQIKHVLARHEQGAVHEADGYARATGNVGAVSYTHLDVYKRQIRKSGSPIPMRGRGPPSASATTSS